MGIVWSEGGLNFTYLNDAEKTRQARNTRGWTTVGDLGHLDDEGYLYLSDRRVDLILSGGVNVYPQEAENVLLTHPAVTDAAVFGIPHDELGQIVHAVVQLDPSVTHGDDMEKTLLDHCTENLARFKCPRNIDFIDRIPRLPTGKLLRRELRESYHGHTGSG